MKDLEKKIIDRFMADIDQISSDFIGCFGLNYSRESCNLSEPLLRWLDFRLRYIDPKPRRVLLSNKFPIQMADSNRKAFNHIIGLIEHGKDVNPYQGKGLILHHDTSGKKRQNRTDLLWADWGIIHFHLTDRPITERQFFSERSKWLMFAIVGIDYIGIIDIRHHKEDNLFSNPDLIKIVAESWPSIMKKFETRKIIAKENELSTEEYFKLRKAGISALIAIGDKAYFGTGMGITTASTSMKTTILMDNILKSAKDIAIDICKPNSEFQSNISEMIEKELSFQLCITPRGMAVYESLQNKAWLLPRKTLELENNYLAKMNDILAPEWAIKRLIPE